MAENIVINGQVYNNVEGISMVNTENQTVSYFKGSDLIDAHNIDENAHNDIRVLIEGLTTRLNALANSTDEDLDQLAEIVAYIKSNKTLIEAITTNKVNVADIIDNLTTNVSNQPLSAAQGVTLKNLIDNISITSLGAVPVLRTINGKALSDDIELTAEDLGIVLETVTPVSKGGTGYTTIEDTVYTTARYRASTLVSTETEPTINGTISWLYE